MEQIAVHKSLTEEDLLDHHLTNRRVGHKLHLLLAIEEQGILLLMHEEMFHLPVLTLQRVDTGIRTHNQRKAHTFNLQTAVGTQVNVKN